MCAAWLRVVTHYAVELYRKADEHHLFLLAGGLAFSICICLVPFVLTIFSLLGLVLSADAAEGETSRLVDLLVPYEGQSSFLKEVLLSRARELVAFRGTFGLIGGLGLLFAASGVFSTMRTILNTLFEVRAQRLELVGKLKDFALVFAVVCLLLGGIALMPLIEALGDAAWVEQLLGGPLMSPIEWLWFHGASLAVTWLAFFTLYHILPYGRLEKRVTAVSALWAAGLWKLAEQGFGFYLDYFGSLQRLYGAYAIGAGILFWIYYSAIVFIAAAQIGQVYRARLALPHSPGDPRQ